MSDSFDTPFSSSECDSLLGGVVRPLTKRKNIEGFQKQARDPANAWHPGRRSNARTNNGLDTFSGLFVYVYLSFIPTHLQGKNEKIRDYPDGWYHADGRKISIAKDTELERFFHVALVEPKPPFRTDDLSFEGRSLYDAVAQHMQARWLTALGLLLAFDEGPGNGGKRFSKGQELEREELEREASSLTVQYNGQTCSKSFVESVLEIYAKNVCGAVLEEKEPCPHCGEQKVEKKPCPHCCITGDSWTCPSCGTKTAVADIPKHGTGGMYCPNCGLPVAGAERFLSRYRVALRLPPDKCLEELKSLQLEYTAIIGFETSWSDLNEHIRQMEAARTTLEKIADAITRKNIAEAKKSLESARGVFPGLDYSRFNRQIADLEAEEEHRKQQKQALDAANEAIQSAINAEKYNVARNKVNETAAKSLPGFNASEWRLKIDQAEAEAERKRKEREAAEKARKIKEGKDSFERALVEAQWDEARRIGRELVRLGEGTEADWSKRVQESIDKRKDFLLETAKTALASGSAALAAGNLGLAKAKADEAQSNLERLKSEFKSSNTQVTIEIGNLRKKIEKKKADMAEEARRNLIERLAPVANLKAEGSVQGAPLVKVSWLPASQGTTAVAWQVKRRKKGGAQAELLVRETGTSSVEDKTAKLGVEYEYSVIPMAEVETANGGKEKRPNEKAETWSTSAVCLAPMPKGSFTGTGQGMDGTGGIVTLKWKMPDGLPAGVPHRFLLSRGDGKFSNKDVTAFNGIFEDEEVTVAESFNYILRFELFGRDMGTANANVLVKKVQPPAPVGKFSFRRSAQGAVLVQWDWPEGLDSCLWGVSEHEAAKPGDIARIAQRRMSKAVFDEKGGVSPVVPPNGAPCWLTVFGIRTFGDREFFSAGRSIPLRETVLEYVVETHPGGVFSRRKPAMIVMRSSTGYFPEMEIRTGKTRAEVLSRRGGRIVDRIAQESSSETVKRIVLDGKVPLGEFVRVYLVHADTENCKLNHPSEFEVR